jgi:Tol biopolymer transport system component
MLRFKISGAVVMAWSLYGAPVSAQAARIEVFPAGTVELSVGQRVDALAAAYDQRDNVANVTYTWTSSDPNVVRVEADPALPGQATLIGTGAGTATVQVRAGGRSASMPVQVRGGAALGPSGSGQATVLQIEPTQVVLLPTEEAQLTTIFRKNDGSYAARESVTFQWLGSGAGNVDQDGRITAIAVGNGLVKATSQSGLTRNVPVTVQAAEWTFEQPVMSLSPGQEDTVSVIVPSQQGRRIDPTVLQFQSSNPNAVFVTPVGVVTGISAGEANIVATGFGSQRTLSVHVHREIEFMDVWPRSNDITVPLGGTATVWAMPLAADETAVPEAVVTWQLGDSSIVGYQASDSTVRGLRIGETSVTVVGPRGIPPKTWTVSVVPSGLKLDVGRFGMSRGERRTLHASYADSNGTPIAAANNVRWTSTNPSAAQVSSNGEVTAVAVGKTGIIASTEAGRADTTTVFVQGALLVTSRRAGSEDVYSVDPGDPAVLSRVTEDPASEMQPAYSPDGSRIAYTSDRDGNLEIYVADADGQGATRLTHTSPTAPFATVESYPAWTPDGAQIVYQANSGTGAQVWIMNADGSNQRQLTSLGENQWPAVSPDGQTIAFVSTRDQRYDVYLMGIDGGNQRNATMAVDGWKWHPNWLDDSTLVFVREERNNREVTRRVVKMSLGGQVEPLITDVNLNVADFSINHDGSVLAVQLDGAGPSGGMSHRVYLIPLGGGSATQVPAASDTDQLAWPSFRP